ncbi:hypothetical protein A3B35_02145 [Candidatus Kaiserbacteria bacterium RIFCSPLOWO2_01_FULL_54_24]|uniref:Glycosyltransferase RgtA/B/C/D-like domain-containing protein n=1 Tax=Candidatus Kaiserbacteria bacterium RIFCSPLOWO2_01_FULL_54_24 TaxID=1798515 RepID=A0A1F6EWD8_9BACT|nr:MAG: hypothetical protein A3B35_02145 [Candidatus Kaiserbacteria bacterium RIFCSPLOWO2_01_FULL_54_24]
MKTHKEFVYRHRCFFALCAAVFMLALIPLLETTVLVGGEWRGVPQAYMDEYIYYSHVTEAGTGNIFFGNPYLLEHRFDAPLVLFGSNVLAALPLLLGLPLIPALIINFILWSVVFSALYYRLLREFALPAALCAAGAFFAYLQSYDQVYRISVRQEVFPFLLFFYIALIRFIKQPESRSGTILLGIAAGSSFYIYGFLWQTVVVTLGLLALYALCTRQWLFLRRVLLGSALGGALGFPALFYTLWVSRQPYFWESMTRFGLVNTHLPVAEVIYSGAWAGIVVALVALIYWRAPLLRQQRTFHVAALFLCVTGMALWIMQGSNVITGQLLEIGDHMRRFIIVWLPLATTLSAYALYNYHEYLSKPLRSLAAAALVCLVGANLYFAYHHSHPFRAPLESAAIWKEQQLYAAPLQWLESHEAEPVVVWGNQRDFSTIHVPVLTKHYALFVEAAQFMLLPTDEIRERYLVSRYFDGVTVESLKEDMLPHAGRANTFHLPKTIERGIKICRIIFFWNKGHDCGVPPTPQALMGEAYFDGLVARFETDIKPNIEEYLKKYQVSYILKDIKRDPQYRPEVLGAVRVYQDARFEVYKLP